MKAGGNTSVTNVEQEWKTAASWIFGATSQSLGMTSSWRFPGFVTSGDFPFSALSDLFVGACLWPRVKSAIFFAYFPFQRESDNGKSVTARPRQFPTFPTNLELGWMDFGASNGEGIEDAFRGKRP